MSSSHNTSVISHIRNRLREAENNDDRVLILMYGKLLTTILTHKANLNEGDEVNTKETDEEEGWVSLNHEDDCNNNTVGGSSSKMYTELKKAEKAVDREMIVMYGNLLTAQIESIGVAPAHGKSQPNEQKKVTESAEGQNHEGTSAPNNDQAKSRKEEVVRPEPEWPPRHSPSPECSRGGGFAGLVPNSSDNGRRGGNPDLVPTGTPGYGGHGSMGSGLMIGRDAFRRSGPEGGFSDLVPGAGFGNGLPQPRYDPVFPGDRGPGTRMPGSNPAFPNRAPLVPGADPDNDLEPMLGWGNHNTFGVGGNLNFFGGQGGRMGGGFHGGPFC